MEFKTVETFVQQKITQRNSDPLSFPLGKTCLSASNIPKLLARRIAITVEIFCPLKQLQTEAEMNRELLIQIVFVLSIEDERNPGLHGITEVAFWPENPSLFGTPLLIQKYPLYKPRKKPRSNNQPVLITNHKFSEKNSFIYF